MAEEPKKKETCGIVMPISSIDGLDEGHWLDVRKILTESRVGIVYVR